MADETSRKDVLNRRTALKTMGFALLGGVLSQIPGDDAIRPRAVLPLRDPEAPLPPEHVYPKAKLVLMGGNLKGKTVVEAMDLLGLEQPDGMPPDSYDTAGIYRLLMERYSLKGEEVTCITSALEKPERAKEAGEDLHLLFKLLGARKVTIIDTDDRSKVDSEEALAGVRNSKLVFMSGGDQGVLAKRLKGTKVYEALVDRYMNDDRFVLAGSSAGAMVVADAMIDGGKVDDVVENMKEGFGLLSMPVDTHFTQRDRRDRMLRALRAYPRDKATAVGVDEATLVEIFHGEAAILGKGNATFARKKGSQIEELSYCDGERCFVGPEMHERPSSHVARFLDEQNQVRRGKGLLAEGDDVTRRRLTPQGGNGLQSP